jgi:hypothetical protein
VGLILLVLGLLGVAVVAISWRSLPDVLGRGTTVEMRPATATVVESAPCGASPSGDLVEVPVNGASKQARLDGCGHTRGQQLQVQVPADPGPDFVVRPASSETAGSGESSGLPNRLSWVLVTLAAIAGGGYMLMLRSRPA